MERISHFEKLKQPKGSSLYGEAKRANAALTECIFSSKQELIDLIGTIDKIPCSEPHKVPWSELVHVAQVCSMPPCPGLQLRCIGRNSRDSSKEHFGGRLSSLHVLPHSQMRARVQEDYCVSALFPVGCHDPSHMQMAVSSRIIADEEGGEQGMDQAGWQHAHAWKRSDPKVLWRLWLSGNPHEPMRLQTWCAD
jgi:hypothetical protein